MTKKKDFLSVFAIIFTIIGVLILFTSLTLLFYNDYINFSLNIFPETASQIGDFVGGFIGSIWAFVGVILLFKTLKLQNKEFSDNKKLLKQQSFESTFFQLLNRQKEILNSILYIDKYGNKYSGQLFFKFVKEQTLAKSKEDILVLKYDDRQKLGDEIFRINLSRFCNKNELEINQYITNLILIMDFIEEGIKNNIFETENFYKKILLSELTEYESFIIIHHNCFELKKYIKSYKLIEKVRSEEFIDSFLIKQFSTF